MSYDVRVAGPAQRYLDRLPRSARERIIARLEQIAEDPYDRHTKPLRGAGALRGARVGGWRIIFTVDMATRTVDVSAIAPRGQVYRDLN